MNLDNELDAPASEVFADFKMIVHPVLRRGLAIHPVKPRGKEPWLNNWPKQATTDLTTVAEWMKRFPNSNYGVAASDQFCILESDNFDELQNRVSRQLPRTYTTQARPNRPHLYFRQTEASRSAGNMDSPGIFEFKQNNRYVVGEGSIHPTGAVYQCIEDAEIVEIPAWLVEDLQRIRQGSGLKMSAALPTDGNKLGEGEGRHPALMSACAQMWDGEKTEAEMFDAVQALNLLHCNPPKEEHKVLGMVRWAMQHEPVRTSGTVMYDKPLPGGNKAWGVLAGDAIASLAHMPRRDAMLTQVGKDGAPDQIVFNEASANQIFAWRGLGKTNLALGLAACFARGGMLLDFQAVKSRVVYVDGELPIRELYERARGFGLTNDVLLISPEQFEPVGAIDLLKAEHYGMLVGAITRHIGDSKGVVILDSQATLMRGDALKTDYQEDRGNLLRLLRWKGLCVIEMHHSGKDAEKQRGSSKNDDFLDVQIQLTPPAGWEPGQGLLFDLNFVKVRHNAILEGGYTVSLKDGVWSKRVSSDEEAVEEKLKEGWSLRKIANEFDMSKSKVQRLKGKIDKRGKANLNEKFKEAH